MELPFLKVKGTYTMLSSYIILSFPGSPYREAVNIALLQLREDGTLDNIKMKWWNKDKAICEVSFKSGKLEKIQFFFLV